jgi:iron complex transport system ATP-binding protein
MSLSARNISYRVGDSILVSDVNAVYESGQLTAILGANGAGKSTLLHCYAGLKPPTTGTILIDGESPLEMDPVDLARKRAFLPQEHQLGFPFTVFDVAMLGRAPHLGYSTYETDTRIVEVALEICDLEAVRRQSYTTLSGGEKQRTHLARVLSQIWTEDELDGRYLILDEPTNSLDIRHQNMLLKELVRLATRGLCVITVLHDINLAAQFVDHIQLMKDGGIMASGRPEDVLTTEYLENCFGIRSHRLHHPETQSPIIVSRMDS